MKNIPSYLTALLILLLISGCAVSSGSLRGVKDIRLPVKSDHNLDTAPGYHDGSGMIERVLFPAKLVSSTTSSNGVTTATIQLSPATDGDELWDIPAKYRIIPNPSQITVRSKKLSRTLLANMEGVSIASIGRHKGNVCLLKMSDDIYATEIKPLASGKTLLTVRNGQYQVTLDDFGRYGRGGDLEWKRGTSDEFRAWQASTSSWKGKPKLYFGDGGASVFLDGKGWHLEGNGAGPGGSDYSYLETNSARGEFD